MDHTAEVQLAIEAATERDVFADAVAALAELLGVAGDAAQATARRTVSVHASDRPALLAAWLEELVFLAESQGFVATKLLSLELDEDSRLEATVAGFVDDPPPIVKAVTYHRLTFQSGQDGYTATVVLDV